MLKAEHYEKTIRKTSHSSNQKLFYKYLLNVTLYDITGNTIPFETESLFPAGDVVYVLAWNYAVNYLEKVMPGRVFVYSLSPNNYQIISFYIKKE